MHWSRGFGLYIRSNLPLPGLSAVDRPQEADAAILRVEVGALPPTGGTPQRVLFQTGEADGAPSLCVRDLGAGGALFVYGDGTQFVIDADGATVWGAWPGDLTLEDAATYLLGPVMAFVLRRRGVISLHAGAVETRRGALAIAGAPEAGKSTLLAMLARHGFRVLGDDVAPVRMRGGQLWVDPAYPRLRLWPDSVAHLFGASDALPRITPTWDKRYLELDRGEFHDGTLPLGAVLLLAERSGDRDAPRIRPLGRREAFAAVLAHLHTVWMLPDEPQEDAFRLASAIVRSVPVAGLVAHSDPARLPDACALVSGWVGAAAARAVVGSG
jgi:hypothetical protein